MYVTGKARAGERGRECERYIFFMYLFHICCYFKCTSLSLETMCQRKISILMLCILLNNRDLFEWFDLVWGYRQIKFSTHPALGLWILQALGIVASVSTPRFYRPLEQLPVSAPLDSTGHWDSCQCLHPWFLQATGTVASACTPRFYAYLWGKEHYPISISYTNACLKIAF